MEDPQKYEKAGFDSRFSIFTPPLVDVATNTETVTSFFPIAPLKEHQVIEFNIPPTTFLYSDFSRCFLKLKIQMKTDADGDVKATDKTSVVNMPYAGLFRQCDIHLNQVGSYLFKKKKIFDNFNNFEYYTR